MNIEIIIRKNGLKETGGLQSPLFHQEDIIQLRNYQ